MTRHEHEHSKSLAHPPHSRISLGRKCWRATPPLTLAMRPGSNICCSSRSLAATAAASSSARPLLLAPKLLAAAAGTAARAARHL